ncbi:MAG: ROK family protein, partial [Acidimicrobiales bacterium]
MPHRDRGGRSRSRRPRAHRRPAPLLTQPRPAPGPARAVGIDVGGTKCLGVALDGAGAVVAEHRVPTPDGPAELLVVLVDLVEALEPAAAVGVGLPGLVTIDGVLVLAPNLPGAADLDVQASLRARWPEAAIRVDNDATCAGWAEARVGAARGCSDAILVTLGTGIGGGIVSAGRVLRGAHGFAGELGHMVVDPNGPPCPCGQRGCWERFASGRGLG